MRPLGWRLSEAELLRAVSAGSLDALGELYRAHADAVITLAFRMTGSRAEAEDVLQDVFVALPRALRGYHEQGRFAAWLKRTTVRTVLMRMRAAERRRETNLQEHLHDVPAASADRPVEWIALETALCALPSSLRAVFVLKELEGYSHAEIAELLDISPAAAMTRLSRAWHQLRKELAP
jgi:RNA polymerase sigma-70 factor (ECF subfamily)